MTFYQLGRSVGFNSDAARPGFQGEALALTSEAGWAEKDLRVLQGDGDSRSSSTKALIRRGLFLSP